MRSINPKSSEAVRANIVETLRRDLIGPDPRDADIAREHLKADANPSRWYLTGFLVPNVVEDIDADAAMDETGDMALESEPSDPETGKGIAADDTPPDVPAARRPPLPSSCGLTVLVDARAETVEVDVWWGDYVTIPPLPESILSGEASSDEYKHPKVEWQRIPCHQTVTIRVPTSGRGEPTILPQSGGQVRSRGGLVLEAHARPYDLKRPDGWIDKVRALTVMLVNRRDKAPRRFADVTYAFQVKIQVRSEIGLYPRTDMTGFGTQDLDAATADLHYRDVAEYAIGSNTAAGWAAPDEDGKVRAAWTDFLPTAEVERVEPNETIDAVEFGMERLAELAAEGPDALAAALAHLPAAYEAWIAGCETRIGAIDGASRQATARRLVDAARRARGRIASGIELLQKDKWSRLAFRAMNESVARANRRRNAGKDGDPAAQKPPKWRPFQLAFVLINLAGLQDKLNPEREIVDLLFFPTGGGKTEAYLGLAAWTIAHRRLTGSGLLGAGVAVLMRYTLRLLTLDQLARAAGVICALELMRGEPAWMLDDKRVLGDWPIEIGLWVGSSASPNRLGGVGNSDENTAVIRVRRYKKDGREAPAPIKACPWCSEEFTRDSFQCVPNDKTPHNMAITCVNPDCDFTRGRPLPILTVDEAIYRRLPAFIVATVDKFAGLPWIGAAGAFFGNVDRHDTWGFYGASDPDGQGTPLHAGASLDPPDLVIQDELHLISGPLGTIAALYELVLDLLSTRYRERKAIRPKVVASTATVRKAAEQIAALFDRHQTEIFPPPGSDRRDSYFAITVPPAKQPARLYVGLAAPGKGPKLIFLRVLTTLLAAAQAEADAGSDADAYMTALCYFNALRELGGARRIVEDEVRRGLSTYGSDRCRIVPAGAPFADRSLRTVIELTSRATTDQVAAAKDQLAKPASDKKEGVDVALATNMISVGLDIGRLGLMLMQGQPKAAAEYIQATSRVGRVADKPGLVLALLNAHKPRDRMHYEGFRNFHERFYRAVEATSVTPWAARAIDRAIAAVVVAAVRHLRPALTEERAAIDVSTDATIKQKVTDAILARAPANAVVGGHAALRAIVEDLIDTWAAIADDRDSNAGRLYYGYPKGQALMHDPLDPILANLDPRLNRFKAGRSMRDVEHSSSLKVVDPHFQPLP